MRRSPQQLDDAGWMFDRAGEIVAAAAVVAAGLPPVRPSPGRSPGEATIRRRSSCPRILRWLMMPSPRCLSRPGTVLAIRTTAPGVMAGPTPRQHSGPAGRPTNWPRSSIDTSIGTTRNFSWNGDAGRSSRQNAHGASRLTAPNGGYSCTMSRQAKREIGSGTSQAAACRSVVSGRRIRCSVHAFQVSSSIRADCRSMTSRARASNSSAEAPPAGGAPAPYASAALVLFACSGIRSHERSQPPPPYSRTTANTVFTGKSRTPHAVPQPSATRNPRPAITGIARTYAVSSSGLHRNRFSSA